MRQPTLDLLQLQNNVAADLLYQWRENPCVVLVRLARACDLLSMRCHRKTPARATVAVMASYYSCDNGSVTDAPGAKHSSIPLNLRWHAERFCIVIRKLHCWPAVDGRYLADQTNRIKIRTIRRVTPAEIIGQQSSPTRAESNAAARVPLLCV